MKPGVFVAVKRDGSGRAGLIGIVVMAVAALMMVPLAAPLTYGYAGAVPPTHVAVIFDTSRSFWIWQHIAYAVTDRLLRELYFALPGHPDDRVSFVVLNSRPTIVAELSGAGLRRKAGRAFLEAYRAPDPEPGSDVVGAFEMAWLAFSRSPNALKFLFAFTDLRVDPGRTSSGKPRNFRALRDFEWSLLSDVSVSIFLTPAEMELAAKRDVETLRKARFYSPPPMVRGIVDARVLRDYVDRITAEFRADVNARLKAARHGTGNMGGDSGTGGAPPAVTGLNRWMPAGLGVLAVVMLLALLVLGRRSGSSMPQRRSR